MEEAQNAYEVVAGSEPSLGILLEYKTPEEMPNSAMLREIRLCSWWGSIAASRHKSRR